ncbi:MAG: response regulator, partial [Anaerolineales bacterium]|nr:response regulator [Anaerolineales bacterium]
MADKFRVLIVDDHQEIRTALRANLEALDVDLDLVDVPSGEEAIVEVVGTGIDLLIADVGLPGLSGIELYKKLKHTLEVVQGITFMDINSLVTVVAPVSFDLKTEVELMAEFANTQKGLPADIRYNAYYNFINQRYANDFEAKRMAEISVQYTTFILYTSAERSEMIASNQIEREDAIKAANVFDILVMLINEDAIDIINGTYSEIKPKIDALMELRIADL